MSSTSYSLGALARPAQSQRQIALGHKHKSTQTIQRSHSIGASRTSTSNIHNIVGGVQIFADLESSPELLTRVSTFSL